ncbi:MAG TPA: class I SAM-dependent methyltransferase [Acidimicrobiales bacterium]|nr:class I SAM-dependent methyltransferase [Acidimicrobiales bacterium]
MARGDGASARPGTLAAETGVRRSVDLFRAFRLEQTDPDHFYRIQAADAVAQLCRYAAVKDRLVLDIGGGAGYFTEAFVAAGARCILVEPESHLAPAPGGEGGDGSPRPVVFGAAPDGRRGGRADTDPEADRRRRHQEAVRAGRLAPGRTVAGDALRLPVAEGTCDVTFSSNVLEHVPAPGPFLDEMVRVTRPGGTIYVSFTAWYSLWGGHETAPWHYLGGERAARRYERKTGRPPGNRFGSSLFACHVGPTLRLARSLPGVDVVDALPRYYPGWLRWVVTVPGLREIATWNLLLVLRRRTVRP